MLEEAYMPVSENYNDDDEFLQPEINETITSPNSLILCDSVESVIELSYLDLNTEVIANATLRHLEICMDLEVPMF